MTIFNQYVSDYVKADVMFCKRYELSCLINRTIEQNGAVSTPSAFVRTSGCLCLWAPFSVPPSLSLSVYMYVYRFDTVIHARSDTDTVIDIAYRHTDRQRNKTSRDCHSAHAVICI